MTQQLHKRLSQEVVEKVLEAFNEHRISEDEASQMLGLKRARLYILRREWLRKASRGEFTLCKRKSYLTRHLPEEAEKRFGHPFHRNTFRRFALRHDYYHALPEEKQKVYSRGLRPPGCSFHTIPLTISGSKPKRQSLILTKDDYSRRFVKALITLQETSWDHLCMTRAVVEDVALPQAYYLDNHSIF